MEQFEQSDVAESSVDIKEYIHLFWSWAWLIVLAGLVAGGRGVFRLEADHAHLSGIDAAAGQRSILGQRQCRSHGARYDNDHDQHLCRDADGPTGAPGVIDKLKLPTTVENLTKVVTVDAVTNTQLLTITVQDPNPQQAIAIANAIASTFVARISDLQSQRYSASREGLSAQVADMEKQIADTTAQITVLQQQATPPPHRRLSLREKVRQPRNRPRVPTDSAAMIQLQARLTQYRTIYSNLVTSYEQVRLSEEQTSTNVVVSEPATAESSPVKPKTAQNTALAIVAGMLLAAAVVFAADSLDDTIKNPEELRRKFNLSILGMIAWHEAPKDKPIVLAQPRSPTAEAFRSLRTNMTYAALDKPLRRIMITSPTAEDGKTTVACNLAVVVSQNEKQVVLVDADMRRPQVHNKFGLHNRLGLSELFVRPIEAIASVIQAVDIPRLAVITSGSLPPNPAELLTSKMMGKILDRLNQAFELIVIDTPPLLSVTDAAALAPALDGVILVVKPGATKLGALQQALEHLTGC